ncbi:MAG: DUF3570 domain-containing protein [Gammaproteobacteria bacterium]|nr:DUF3570 domain-containing protein [Gammaproteobacteria bacterium]
MWQYNPRICRWIGAVCFIGTIHQAIGTVLPEDRADLMYHEYSGDAVTVTGPSLLVRKQTSTNTSAYFNHYVDHVSSASIDVRYRLGASRYTEQRTEQTGGLDYVHGKTLMGLGITKTSEKDYKGKTYQVNLSQDFFGDLSTLTMGYSKAADTVTSTEDSSRGGDIRRQNYRIGLSQIVSKNMIVGLGWETITDEGYLQSPYRVYSYCTDSACTSRSKDFEKFPGTRTSNTVSLHGSYYLQYRAALHGNIKLFQDSWGVNAQTMELGYTHTAKSFIIDLRYRLYKQTKADFYNDLFAFRDQFNFMTRHKELSTFNSNSGGVTLTYNFAQNGWWVFQKGSANIAYDHINFNYKDFRDATVGGTPGTEPLFRFQADVTQVYLSLWF